MTVAVALAGQLERIVLGRIEADRLVIPSIPTVAMRCLGLVRASDTSNRQISSAIEQDPSLVLALLRSANAASFGSTPIRSVEQAVQRLGLDRVRTVLVEASAHKLFESRDPRIQAAWGGLWAHSLAVAILARDLAALSGNRDGEGAYLGGLLHDVGKPIVAAFLLEAERSIGRGGKWIDSTDWIDTVQRVHRKIGVALAQKWMLEPEITEAIRDCGEYDPAQRGSIANVVRFANVLAKRHGICVGPVDREEVDALVMVGRSLLGIEDSAIEKLLDGLEQRVKAQM